MPPFVLVTLLVAILANGSQAAESGPLLPLAKLDRLAIEKSLGKGAIGEAISAPNVDDPARYLALAAGHRTYRVITGPDGNRDETHRSFPMKHDGGNVTWHYELGSGEIGFLDAKADGSFVMSGIQDFGEGVWTQYSPPEPVLIKGLAAGDESKVTMAVKVYDLNKPEVLKHEGSLDVIYRYLGAYRLTLPAGTYDAILLKSTFNGKIGPATVDDTQYRFFVAHLGMAATVERREVSAFLLYHRHLDVAKVLTARPN